MTWIKVDHTTPNKPEVLRLARHLGVSRDDAFGKAMRFWLWLDSVSVDGRVDGVAPTDVDAIVDAAGFSDGLQAVGWLEYDETQDCLMVPNFDRHNGETAKARANKTKRQAAWRAKGGGTVDARPSTRASTRPSTNGSTREEKRRKENTSSPPPNTCSNGEPTTTGGGGGSGWAELQKRLAVLGMTDVAGMRRRCVLNAVEASEIVDFWQRVGQWPLAALHWRLSNGVPGVLSSEGWPPPGGGQAQDLDRDAKRQRQTSDALAYRIVREGRRNKLDEQAIRAELAQHGCEWPGEKA